MGSLGSRFGHQAVWAGHVSRMLMSRVPRKLLTSWVAKPRSFGSPQMTWGRTLNKALQAAGVPSTFTKWRNFAEYRDQWRVLCGAKARGAVHAPSKFKALPRHLGPGRRLPTALQPRPPGDGANAPTAPIATHPGFNTRAQRHSARWAAFMGDRAFVRARAAGKNATEAGHARTKAEANIALGLPEEYGD